MRARLLLVDDEAPILRALERFLTEKGFEVFQADTFDKACQWLDSGRIDLALIDLRLQDHLGIELVRRVQSSKFKTATVIMTGHATLDTAIEAIKAGAFHYITKPFHFDDIFNLVQKALEHRLAREENLLLRKQLCRRYGPGSMIGVSAPMQEVFGLIEKVAPTDSTVLVLGESGTGKELVAKALHYQGRRASQNLVTVNCGAIPEELLESELFGHVKGAFTGAVTSHVGRFETADKGTLFLDEIGDMNLKLQVKLLRVLQEKKIDPVGSGKSKDVDVRIVAATHKDLEQAVQEKTFREDLFYRLNVIPIKIPALRERREDIPVLAQFFLEKYARENGKEPLAIEPGALEAFSAYAWPGNVRELENTLERLVILKSDDRIVLSDLPDKIVARLGSRKEPTHIPEQGLSFKHAVSRFENELILQALQKAEGNKNKAASLLKLNRTTLVEKIKKRQLDKTIVS